MPQLVSVKMLPLCIFVMSIALLGQSDAAFSALPRRVKAGSGQLTSRTTNGAQLLASEDFGVEQSSVSSIPPARLSAKMRHAIALVFLMSASLAVAFLVKKCFGVINSDKNASSARRLAEGGSDDRKPCITTLTTSKTEQKMRVIEGVLWEVDEENKILILDIPGDRKPLDDSSMMVDGEEWIVDYRPVGNATPLSGNRRVKKGRVPKIIDGVYFEADENKQCLIKEISGNTRPKDVVTRYLGTEYYYKYKTVGKATPVSGHARVGGGHARVGGAEGRKKILLINAKLKGVEYYVDEARKIAYPRRGDGPRTIKLGGEDYEVKSETPEDAFVEGEGFLNKELAKITVEGQEYYVDKERGTAYVIPKEITLEGKEYTVQYRIPTEKYRIPK